MNNRNLFPQQAEEIQSKLATLRSACGCKSGAVFLLAGLILSIALYETGALQDSERPFVLCASICLAAAVIGKIAGILWSRMRYFVLKEQLNRLRSL